MPQAKVSEATRKEIERWILEYWMQWRRIPTPTYTANNLTDIDGDKILISMNSVRAAYRDMVESGDLIRTPDKGYTFPVGSPTLILARRPSGDRKSDPKKSESTLDETS